jgi:hypothetical protein
MTLECRDTKLWPIFGWHPHVSTLKGGKGRSPQKKKKEEEKQMDKPTIFGGYLQKLA